MRILIVVVRRNAPARRIATRRLPPLRHADEYCWEDRPTAVHAAVVVGTVQRPELPPVIYAYKDAAGFEDRAPWTNFNNLPEIHSPPHDD